MAVIEYAMEDRGEPILPCFDCTRWSIQVWINYASVDLPLMVREYHVDGCPTTETDEPS